MVGLSLKTKSAPSRAPAASMTAESMRRELSEIRAPPSARARDRRELPRCATACGNCWSPRQDGGARTQSRMSVACGNNAPRERCWLVWCWRRAVTGVSVIKSSASLTGPAEELSVSRTQCSRAQKCSATPRTAHNQQPLRRRSRIHFFMLQNPGIAVGHENRVQSRSQRRIDVRPGAVADHPCGIAREFIFGDQRVIDGGILLGDDLGRREIFFQARALDLSRCSATRPLVTRIR